MSHSPELCDELRFGELNAHRPLRVIRSLRWWIAGPHGYGPAFLIAGVLHPLAFLVILATVKHVRPIRFNPVPAASI